MTVSDPVPDQGTAGRTVDLSRAPRGEMTATALVEMIAVLDDRVENHYLEVKGPLDLSTKKDQAKLAKFLLGAANRTPEVAATAFEGYGVMVIGVSPGKVVGVPPIEVLEIDKAVRPFVGAELHWDLQRVPVPGSVNEVLILLIDPPQPGQPPFICRKSGDGLRDGAVYVRPTGETREANADELAQVIARGQIDTAPAVDFAVNVLGEAVPLTIDSDATLEEYVASTRARLLGALPQPESEPPVRPSLDYLFQGLTATRPAAVDGLAQRHAVDDIQATWRKQQDEIKKLEKAAMAASTKSFASFLGLDTEPEPRSEEQYRNEVDRWEQEFRDAWSKAIEILIGARLPAVTVEVSNREETFFHDVELVLHLEGDVLGVEAGEVGEKLSLYRLDLPRPPRPWGPKKRDLFTTPAYYATPGYDYRPSPPPSMTWNNTGSVTAEFDIGTLRGTERYRCDDSTLVLVTAASASVPIHGTWQITARDHNRVYRGEVAVQLGELVDLTPSLREALGLTVDHEA